MVTRDDLESYLIRMDADFDEVDDGMFLVRTDNGGAPIVVHHSEPLLLVRMKVMDLPADSGDLGGLYETLLRLKRHGCHSRGLRDRGG